MRVSDRMRQKQEYFVRIIDIVERNKVYLRNFFENMTVVKPTIIQTDENNEIEYLNENNAVNFIDYELDKVFENHDYITCKNLHILFLNYCDFSGDERKRLTIKYFSPR